MDQDLTQSVEQSFWCQKRQVIHSFVYFAIWTLFIAFLTPFIFHKIQIYSWSTTQSSSSVCLFLNSKLVLYFTNKSSNVYTFCYTKLYVFLGNLSFKMQYLFGPTSTSISVPIENVWRLKFISSSLCLYPHRVSGKRCHDSFSLKIATSNTSPVFWYEINTLSHLYRLSRLSQLNGRLNSGRT